MSTQVIEPPVPKPRTRLFVSPKPAECLETSITTNGQSSPDVLQLRVAEPLYPALSVISEPSASLPHNNQPAELTRLQHNDAPPKPPRMSPPLRPPPPIGWNSSSYQNLPHTSEEPKVSTRAAPPPPSRPPPLRLKSPITPSLSSGSSTFPNSPPDIVAPSPPVPPRPPLFAPCVISPSSPNEELHPGNQLLNQVIPLLNESKEISVDEAIENSLYMKLADFRTVSTISEPHDTPSHNRQRKCSEQNTWSSCTSPLYENESPRELQHVCMRDTSRHSLDKPLPSLPSVSTVFRTSVYNSYTPPPKRGEFSQTARSSNLDPLEVHEIKYPSLSLGDITLDIDDDPIDIASTPSPDDTASGTSVSYFGYVSIHAGKKERKHTHARLKNLHLSFHEDDESTDYVCGPYQLSGCQLIARKEDTLSIRLNEHEKEKHCIFTAEDSSETWMMLLALSWLNQYDLLRSGITTNVMVGGNFFLRQGTAASWQRAAGCLVDRTIQYILLEVESADTVFELDIRKILNIRDRAEKDQWCTLVKKKNHRGPFILSLDGCSFYIECEDEFSTNHWMDAISTVLAAPAIFIDRYRLNCDNVPHIVDKCIKFVAAYGMESEGIYRRNGKISEAKEIISKLHDDPCGIHLKPENGETVYAVADVLRQFFRKLQEPLIPQDYHHLLFAAASTMQPVKWTDLKIAMESLPLVNYMTLRKLMAHLKEVSSHSSVNRATVENLAKIFGASLFHTDSENNDAGYKNACNNIAVVAALISGYDEVFQVTTREEISRDLLKQAQNRTCQSKVSRADGLLVPIHLFEKENMPFNCKTDLASEEVVRQAITRRGFKGPLDGRYALYEIVRGGSLRRRLPESERLSTPIINRWIPWKCLDGFIMFDHDTSINEDDMSSFSGRLKLAEPGSKSFKSMELKIEAATKVVAMKNEKSWKDWNMQETVWFMGAEQQRKAPYPHNLTFMVMEETDFMEKFVGYCLSFKLASDRTRFINRINYVQNASQPVHLVHI